MSAQHHRRITAATPGCSRYARGMVESFAGFTHSEVQGMPLLVRRDGRFKTLRISLCLQRPLDRRAAARSLLPDLLVEGTTRDPDRPALARRMEQQYGSAAGPATFRLGESHALRLTLDCVAGDFLPGKPDQIGEGLAFLGDLIARPLLEGGAFPGATFQRKQREAADSVRAQFDDKTFYAREQALEKACAGEPMAIPEHGGLPAIEALGPADPEAARRDFLERGRGWALAMGALPDGGLEDLIAGLLAELGERRPEPVPEPMRIPQRERQATVERADLQQSKMVLVFRLQEPADASGWAARSLMVNLLGGGPHSRLFREVRENKSLAYYASAGLDRHKGLVLVQVGLDDAAAEQVEAETLEQIRQLAAGGLGEQEMETAKATILGGLSTVEDSITSCMTYTSEHWVLGEDLTPEAKMQLIESVDAGAVARVAGELWLDHSYLLAPSDNGGGAP